MNLFKSYSGKTWTAGTLTYSLGGLVFLSIWLIGGDFPWSMRDRAVTPAATVILKQIGITDFLYGVIVIAFPNFTNLFLSPVISYISDRHRGRYGRRIPFLLFTTPFIVLGLCGLGLTAFFGKMIHAALPAVSLHAAMLTVFCITWILLDFGTTLSNSLFYALINDVVPEVLLGRFFSLLRIVSLGAGVFFNYCLLAEVPAHSAEIFVGLGIVYGIGLTLLCWKVKEGQYPPPPPVREDQQGQSAFHRALSGTIEYFRQSFSLPYYRWLILATSMAMALAFGPVNYFAIQYAQSVSYSLKSYGICLVISLLCSLCLSWPLGCLADRFHPLRTGVCSLAAYFILMCVSFFLMADPQYFGIIFTTHCIVNGLYTTLTASLLPRLLPRTLFAQFNSACAIVSAVFSIGAGPLFGWIVDTFGGGYRLLFLLGGAGTLLTFAVFLPVFRGFLKFGGYEAYSAPEPR